MPLSSQNSLARRCGSARAGPQAAAATIAAAANANTARERPVAAAPTPRLINAAIAPSLGARKPTGKTHAPDDRQERSHLDQTTNCQGRRDHAPGRHPPRRPRPRAMAPCTHVCDGPRQPKLSSASPIELSLIEPGLIELGLFELGLFELGLFELGLGRTELGHG